jgi:hypothetical protein
MKLLRSLASLVAGTPLALVLLLAAPAAAQCLNPDNLDLGGPCGSTFTNVPQRGFNSATLGICFNNCSVAGTANYTAKWGPLLPFNLGSAPGTPPSCGWYESRLMILQGATLHWAGTMHLTYSRTWLESIVPGTVDQVYRFLVNGDLFALTTSASPCGTPNCASSFSGRVRFTGYVDFTRSCATGIASHAWMLMHACDAVDHVAGFPRAGSFHPGRAYAFVGPSWNFVPGAGSTLEAGVLSQEGMRGWNAFALPARCLTEEPLIGGVINPLGATCMCSTAGPNTWYEGSLSLGGAFGATLAPFGGSDPFRSFPIGQWTNPTTFPGVEEVRWNSNEGQWTECSGVGRQEYYFGVTTSGGFPAWSFNSASTPSVPLPQTFIDQSNSMLLPASLNTRNEPFRSDHIVNLNL